MTDKCIKLGDLLSEAINEMEEERSVREEICSTGIKEE